MWNPNKLDFKLISMTNQVIHGAVKSSNIPVEFYFSAIYGQYTMEDRRSLWLHLRDIANGIQGPWLVMGDFNTILRPEDRVNGNVVTDAEARDFNDFIVDTGMGELKTVGRNFTWTNSHIFSRIDWAIGNAEWMIHMDHIEVQILDPHFSDHSPLCVDFAETINNRPRPFKFLNYLEDHHDF
ncbi:uncharacterized protein [Nicotiana sylvestris]|uniref:uncharacterized protein n=1 Tax=Nicotiana sylvestris TaxID=4096 RepID=UPI00388C7D3D